MIKLKSLHLEGEMIILLHSYILSRDKKQKSTRTIPSSRFIDLSEEPLFVEKRNDHQTEPWLP